MGGAIVAIWAHHYQEKTFLGLPVAPNLCVEKSQPCRLSTHRLILPQTHTQTLPHPYTHTDTQTHISQDGNLFFLNLNVVTAATWATVYFSFSVRLPLVFNAGQSPQSPFAPIRHHSINSDSATPPIQSAHQMNIEQMCCSLSSWVSLSLVHISIQLFLTSALSVYSNQLHPPHKCSLWLCYSGTDGRGRKYWKGSNIWLLMTNTASLQFKFQIDPWEPLLLRERETCRQVRAPHICWFMLKEKHFCRSIRRELQLFEVGACLCAEPADLGMLQEKKIENIKREKNYDLLYFCGP